MQTNKQEGFLAHRRGERRAVCAPRLARNDSLSLASGEAVEELAGTLVIRVALLFHPEFQRMGLDAAAGGTQRVLDVQHFVKEHVFNGVLWHASTVEPAVHDDLIERGIEAAELCAPGAVAPAESWAMQASFEISAIEAREHGSEIVDRATGSGLHAASARATKRGDTAAGARQEDEAAVSAENVEGRAAAVNAGQENGGGGLEYGQRRAAQSVRQTH